MSLLIFTLIAFTLAGWLLALACWADRNDQRRNLYDERKAHAETHRNHAHTRAELIACVQDEAALVAYANGQMASFEGQFFVNTPTGPVVSRDRFGLN